MCFGGTKTSEQQTTSTPIINPAVQSAATQSLQQAQTLSNQPYSPYTGDRVADFSPLQNTAFNTAGNYAATTVPTISNMYSTYANAPGPSVNAPPIYSQMGPYMNQYVQQALAPQLEAQNQQFAAQNQNLNAQATASGAFGDPRAGIQAANLTNQQNIARTGLLGQAYNNAFNTAIGAGAQDVGFGLTAQTTNANLYNATLQRLLGGGQALQQLDPSVAAFLQQQGGLQQQQQQAQLNVPYSNYLAAQQWPFLTGQNLNAAIAAGSGALPAGQTSTSTLTQPNNSGWALLGAMTPSLFNGGNQGFGGSFLGGLGSAAMALPMFSDERIKEDIEPVGTLNDGKTNVYSFRYKGSPTKMFGVLAQEVEETYPETVTEIRGLKAVDYGKLGKLAGVFGMAA